MKVLVNGGINLSELDGWWAEAYLPDLGWALGDGCEHGYDPRWDAAEAEALYGLLEQEVIPEFYDRNEKEIPKAWVARMRQSMAELTPHFQRTARCGTILSNITFRLHQTTCSARPITGHSVRSSQKGSKRFMRCGPSYALAK